MDIFFDNNCSDSPLVTLDFEQGCNFMGIYDGYVNAEIKYNDARTTCSPTVDSENPDGDNYCRFGASGGILFPAGYCSITYSPYGNESSSQVVCIGDQRE